MNGSDLEWLGMRVARALAQNGYAGDREDVAQDVAIVALETHARTGYPLRGNVSYYMRAAYLYASEQARRRYKAVSYGAKVNSRRKAAALTSGDGRQGSHVVVECGFSSGNPLSDRDGVHVYRYQPSSSGRADRSVLARDAVRVREQWRGFLGEYVDPGDRGDEVRMLFGIGFPEMEPEQIHAAGGRKPQAILASLANVGRKMARDPKARRAAQEVLEHSEV